MKLHFFPFFQFLKLKQKESQDHKTLDEITIERDVMLKGSQKVIENCVAQDNLITIHKQHCEELEKELKKWNRAQDETQKKICEIETRNTSIETELGQMHQK